MSTLLEQASLVMVPSGYKEDTVYSVVPSDGSGDLSFTRASNGTRVNSAGLVEVCPWNLLEQSEALNTTWTDFGTGVTVTANATTAPNGTSTADKLEFPTSSSGVQYVLGQIVNVEVGVPYTFSFWAKAVSGTITNLVVRINGTEAVLGQTITTEWQRFTKTLTPTIASDDTGFKNRSDVSGSGTAINVYIWGAQLNIGSTAKPYFPTTDRLNVPRLTYQNGGGGCPSLLLEKQSTNLLKYREQFENSNWTKLQGNGGSLPIITENYGISPDGTQNADRIQLTRTTQTSSFSYVYQNYVGTVGVAYSWSVWLKSLSGTPSVALSYDGSIYLNIVTLTTEWQRYTFTSNAINPDLQATFLLFENLSSTSLSADFLAWGAQLEASSYPTSYIPTTSSSATRVIDDCRKTGISSLIGQSEGTLFIDLNLTAWDSNSFYFGLYGGGNEIYFRCTATGAIGFVHYFGSTQAFLSQSGLSLGRHKLAACYKNNDWAFYVDGILAGTDTSGTFSGTISEMVFGYTSISAYPPFHSVNQAILFPTRLTNAELASLTTI